MTKVYVLQVQGTGDDEDAFENIGVFTTQQEVLKAKFSYLEATMNEDAVFNVDEFVLDVCTYG